MNCPICKSTNTKEIFNSFPGYIESSKYKIHLCRSCNLHFISTKNLSSQIYNLIYNQENTPGYERYYEYAKDIKSHSDPLKFLAYQEPSYFPIYQYLKKTSKKLKILEVGCGYGYLTYSMRKRGHNVEGIDISDKAIHFAKTNLGNFYSLSSIENFKSKELFDLIVANELIEHLHDIHSFIEGCLKQLKPEGVLILATPNKDYYPRDSVWQTDLPPVHTLWITKKSIKELSKIHHLKYEFTDFSDYICEKENILITFIHSLTTKSSIPLPVINKTGKPLEKRLSSKRSVSRKILKNIFFLHSIRVFSHQIHKILKKDHPTLGIILRKK